MLGCWISIVHAAPAERTAVLVPQTGHLDAINAVDLSPDGWRAVSAGEDGAVLVWDTETSTLLRRLVHEDAVEAMAISPDGSKILSASRDHTVVVWDLRTGTRLATLRDDALAVAWAPDGATVATAGHDGTAEVWDASTGAPLRALVAGALTGVSFSPDGRQILTTSEDGVAILWDARSGRRRHTLAHAGPVRDAAFSPDGRRVITASDDGTAIVWRRGRAVLTLSGHDGPVTDAAFSPNGAHVATGGADGTVRMWSAASGAAEWSAQPFPDPVTSVAFSPDGARLLAASSEASSATLFDAEGTTSHVFDDPLFSVRSARFSPDGATIAIGTWLSSVGLFRPDGQRVGWLVGKVVGVPTLAFSPDGLWLAGGGLPHVWVVGADPRGADPFVPLPSNKGAWSVAFAPQGHRVAFSGAATWVDLDAPAVHPLDAPAEIVAWSPDGTRLAAGGRGGALTVWDVATDRQTAAPEGHRSDVRALAWSPDGRRLASASKDEVFVWDGAAGTRLPAQDVRSLAFSPDGARLMTAGWSGEVILWDGARDDRRLKAIGAVRAASFSPDGARIAAASTRGVEVWDVVTGTSLRRPGEEGGVTSVAFSPDGTRLAAGATSGDVWLWTADRTDRLVGHLGRVFTVAFSPDGRVLASGSLDGSTRLWDGVDGTPIAALAANRSGWSVTDAEGRFDAAEDGATTSLAWVIGDEPYELMQLQSAFYEPGLLAKRLGVRAERLREVPSLSAVPVPPRLFVDGPSPSGAVRLRAEDRGGGAGAWFVTLNATDISSVVAAACPDLLAGCTVDLSTLPIWLPGEPNELGARLTAPGGAVRSRGLDVALTAAGAPEADPPDLWVAAVGTSDYAGDALDLRYASADASRFAEALGRAGVTGFGPGRTHVRVWATGATPATPGTLDEIVRWLADADPHDTFVLFLAGHGASRTDGTVDDYFYLLPGADGFDGLADPTWRAAHAWSGQQLATALAATAPLARLVVLDTCAAGKADLPLGAPRGLPSDVVRAHVAAQARTGAWLLAGAAADRPSYEASRYGQGVLTYSLLEGMKGPALAQDEVRVGRLVEWAERAVPEHAAGIGGVQQPVVRRGGSDFPLGALTLQDRSAITLLRPLPVVVSARVVPADGRADRLGVEAAIDAALRDAASSGKFVVWSTDPVDGTWQVTGRYTEKARGLGFTGFLTRTGDDGVEIPLLLAGADPDELAAAVAAAVTPRLRSP